MKVLYVGYAIPKNEVGKWLGPSVAGNNMENGIIKGLREHLSDDFNSVSIIPIAQFPGEKQLIVRKRILYLDKGVHSTAISFLNFPLIKQLSIMISIFLFMVNWLVRNRKDKELIVLTYNAHGIISMPVRMAEIIFRFNKVCLFIDPPIDLYSEMGIKGWLKGLDCKIFEHNIKCYDAFVSVNKEAMNRYAPNKPYLIINGGIQLDEFIETNFEMNCFPLEEQTIKLMFAGALTKYNGIELILEAFNKLPDNYRLYIFGGGPLEEFVRICSDNDNRIYFGGIISNSSIRNIERNMDVLLNLRNINDPISKYAFPSKIIEYMLSETPVITTKVNALMSDYQPYLYFIDEETPDCVCTVVKRVVEQEIAEAREKGIRAKQFILKTRTWDILGKKIYDLLVETAESSN